ncbi:hypothetical protein D3C75_717700 [compost metagenome]
MTTPQDKPDASAPHSRDRFERSINKFRVMHLLLAEAFDAWRVVPRMFLALYGAMLWWLVKWFTTSRTIEKITCDKDLIIDLSNKHFTMDQIQALACTVSDVIHITAPGTAHTVFATTVAGLATAVFAFYANTGKDWNRGVTWWRLRRTDELMPPPPAPEPITIPEVVPPPAPKKDDEDEPLPKP